MIRLIFFFLFLIPLHNSYGGVDRLEQLSKTLSQGSYQQDSELDSPVVNIRLRTQQPKNPLYEWVVNCSKDRFDNTKRCYLERKDLAVILVNGNYYILIGTNHYPRSKSALKIDNNKTLYGTEGIISSSKIAIEQMKRGGVAYTRYREWPYDFNRDDDVDLSGFREGLREMQQQYSKL